MAHTPEIPKSVLHDIGEFTDGFFLITITPEGNIEAYDHLSSFVQCLAVEKFMEQFMRNKDELALSKFMDNYFEADSSQKPAEEDDST